VTTGNTGRPLYSICPDRVEACTFEYAENMNWAWTQVKVTNETLTLLSQGIKSTLTGT